MIRLRTTSLSGLLLLVAGCLFGPLSASAQLAVDADPGSSIRTRADLEGLLESYEQALASPAYSSGVKNDIRARAERIRERLTNGDFKLGDRVVLYVQGEPTIPDTIAVTSSARGPKITLPLFGDIPLAGVLRSEIEEAIQKSLSLFIRDPVVQATGLMRISVQGSVTRPGFYVVPADILLSEAIMLAGGPAGDSKLDKMRVERGGTEILSGDALQEELRQGTTLDQLNLQAGDQIFVPQSGTGGFFANVGLILGVATSVSLLLFQLR